MFVLTLHDKEEYGSDKKKEIIYVNFDKCIHIYMCVCVYIYILNKAFMLQIEMSKKWLKPKTISGVLNESLIILANFKTILAT